MSAGLLRRVVDTKQRYRATLGGLSGRGGTADAVALGAIVLWTWGFKSLRPHICDVFENRPAGQDHIHAKYCSSYRGRCRGGVRSAGVCDRDLACCQPRGLYLRHRVLGSGRKCVPPDGIGAAEELLTRRLVGSGDQRLPSAGARAATPAGNLMF